MNTWETVTQKEDLPEAHVGDPAIFLPLPAAVSQERLKTLEGFYFMSKLHWMKFSPYDWINDTRELSPEAKAAWIDMICLMWNAPKRGEWSGSFGEFARATGLPYESAMVITTELGKKVADVTNCNGDVTLLCRRMVKERIYYENSANRVHDFRMKRKCNANVTDKTLDVRHKTLDVKTTTTTTTTTTKASNFDFESVWKQYPRRIGRKSAESHFRASVKCDVDFDAIKRALANYVKDIVGKDIQYVQHGSTWFNNWHDWVDYKPQSVSRYAPPPPKPIATPPKESELVPLEDIQGLLRSLKA